SCVKVAACESRRFMANRNHAAAARNKTARDFLRTRREWGRPGGRVGPGTRTTRKAESMSKLREQVEKVQLNGDGHTPEPASDPYDAASLRLTDDSLTNAAFKKLLTTVPTRKPDKAWWIRVHPGEDYQQNLGFIERKEEKRDEILYLVHGNFQTSLSEE